MRPASEIPIFAQISTPARDSGRPHGPQQRSGAGTRDRPLPLVASGAALRDRAGRIGEGVVTEVAASAVDGLRAAMDGAVSGPGDAGYAAACAIWNGAIDRRPALVAGCTSPADVAAALRFAGEQGLEVSVRGGG